MLWHVKGTKRFRESRPETNYQNNTNPQENDFLAAVRLLKDQILEAVDQKLQASFQQIPQHQQKQVFPYQQVPLPSFQPQMPIKVNQVPLIHNQQNFQQPRYPPIIPMM